MLQEDVPKHADTLTEKVLNSRKLHQRRSEDQQSIMGLAEQKKILFHFKKTEKS